MGFLSGLFKKKPGGTLVGNLIRGAVSKVTGGVAGTGAGIITQKDYDKGVLSDTEYYSRYGETKNGVILPQYEPTVAIQPKIEPKENSIINNATKAIAKSFLHQYWEGLVFIAALVSLGIYSLLKRK